MATETFKVTYDGGRGKENADYDTAHNAATGDGLGKPSAGQRVEYGVFWVRRGFLWFDTSTLGNNCLIKSAVLTLTTVSYYYVYVDFDIIIQKGDGTAPHNPLEDGDYLYTHYSGNGGEVNTSGSPNETIITLNNTGLSWINKTGSTILVLRSSRDINSTEPPSFEYLDWHGWSDAGERGAELEVEYYVPTKIPTVGNASFSGTKDTFTIATANVTDDGGGYEERGFEYGKSEEPTWAVRETGVFAGTGNFSLTISGLQPSTTYYGRAFLTNAYGTVYSDDWTSFTTTASPSYGIYEESNTATICFYVRRVGGKWSIKHGPYTTDQADIEIGKILTEGKGKYQIKFTSDVLTGLSINIMTKLDIKAR